MHSAAMSLCECQGKKTKNIKHSGNLTKNVFLDPHCGVDVREDAGKISSLLQNAKLDV